MSNSFVRVLRDRVLPALDRVGSIFGHIAMAMIVFLIVAMLYEVVARKLFNAPTIWAITVSYMFNGTLFLIGAAFTLRVNQHVRIDFLATRLPLRLQHAVNALFYVGLFMPALGVAAWYSSQKAWDAYVDGELEAMSAWEPLIWPFLAGIALGLTSFLLQVLLETVRHVIGIFDPSLVPGPSDSGDPAATMEG
jgi:TRAP-type mannitol/chloroaromatic compound transport system permease small subunit